MCSLGALCVRATLVLHSSTITVPLWSDISKSSQLIQEEEFILCLSVNIHPEKRAVQLLECVMLHFIIITIYFHHENRSDTATMLVWSIRLFSSIIYENKTIKISFLVSPAMRHCFYVSALPTDGADVFLS